ncbi:MCE-family protein MCE3A [Mycobacterium florentinum]|uniref:MCE-family protein MCE3A n=1 Tax=Mycobacterium florentinum TaxID=292462 RepID=A0A1X1TUE9_MYCFL|nr:MCE family protein [Mycobacterium florentinum]MCV7408515.1 MCE family protein [Mycobacterium florentinum]ORV48039.1 MCE-family protein MCE3A [Mycobacterium florentinum]BBX77984.1 virulence factor [Mycobacterium florentinum]
MKSRSHGKLHPGWWALAFVALVVTFVGVTVGQFRQTFTDSVPVVLTSERAGLVMEPGAKVKMRGVQVGRVKDIRSKPDSVRLDLSIDPDQLQQIPANVTARIRASTIFGPKYVDLIYPDKPSAKHLAAGTVIGSQNVTTEVNTVFENLVSVLDQVDPDKLNSVLAAFAQGVGGQGPAIGDAITDANHVLLQLNPRAEEIRRDWRSLKGFSATYGDAAQNIMKTLNAVSTTSSTITSNRQELDSLLLNVIGVTHSGIELLGANKDNLIHAVNDLEPTTALLLKYNPSLTCSIVGSQLLIDKYHWDRIAGGNGFSGILSMGLDWGDDPYRYPDNLPIVAAKGGSGGKPGCGSLPDVSKNFPVRQLVTNTGWGTGMDWVPNLGIGFPGWMNFFPVTRGTPEPPSIRYGAPAGPAPGPPPAYPGGPPYGAPWYAPDGTPLYPGLPPGVPSDPAPEPPRAGPVSPKSTPAQPSSGPPTSVQQS